LAIGFAVFGLYAHGALHPHLGLPRGIGMAGDFRYNDTTYERVIRDYNTKDLSI
jgi:hypothetical protein